MAAPYYGYVVGIDTTNRVVTAYRPQSTEGGIWGALSTDGVSSIFAVSGNSKRPTATWGGSEAMLRFSQGPKFSNATTDYFAPSDWKTRLDANDFDLGSAAGILLDVPGATPSTLAVAGGKGGVVHLLNRDDLGGLGTGNGKTGEGLFSLSVTTGWLMGTPASYTSAKGRYVVVGTNGAMR